LLSRPSTIKIDVGLAKKNENLASPSH